MKNRKALYVILSANVVSSFAQGISMLAIPWYFTSLLGRASDFALIFAATTFLNLFWSLYAGTLIDRYSRKRIYQGASLAGAIYCVAVSLLANDAGEIHYLLVASVFTYTFFHYTLHYPNLYAFAQEIFEKNQYGRINATLEVQGQATNAISGATAAVLISGTTAGPIALMGINVEIPFAIEAWTMERIIAVNGAAYFLSFLMISALKYIPVIREKTDTSALTERIKGGFKFLKENPAVFVFGTMSYNVFAVVLTQVFLLMAMYVSNHLELGSDVFASADAFFAIGSLSAGLGIRWIFARFRAVDSIIALLIFGAITFMLASSIQNAVFFFFLAGAFGFANAGSRIVRLTWLFEHVPNHIIGRTTSVFGMINILIRTALIGVCSLAFFEEGSNVIWAYRICAGLLVLSVLPLLIWRKRLLP